MSSDLEFMYYWFIKEFHIRPLDLEDLFSGVCALYADADIKKLYEG